MFPGTGQLLQDASMVESSRPDDCCSQWPKVLSKIQEVFRYFETFPTSDCPMPTTLPQDHCRERLPILGIWTTLEE